MKKMEDNIIVDDGLASKALSSTGGAVSSSGTAEPMDIVDEDLPSSIGNGIDDNFDYNDNPKYQKENRVLKFLPYYELLSDEADLKFNKIVGEIRKSVIYKDFQIGLTYSTKSLQAFINSYGLRFSKEKHLNLIHLYYELLIDECCPVKLAALFAEILNVLLRKPETLNRDDLILEWKPLYLVLQRFIYQRKFPMSSGISTKLEMLLKEVVRNCNVYFKTGTATEVIQEFRPLLCPTDAKIAHGLDMLKIFLPYLDRDAEEEIVDFITSFLLNIMKTYHNVPTWEWIMMGVLATAGVNLPGKINWNEYLSFIYGIFLRNLKLPVRFKEVKLHSSYSSNSKTFDASISARWIVSTLGNNKEAMDHLEVFFNSVQTYYNPNNTGRWSTSLIHFLIEVVTAFTRRHKKEKFLMKNAKRWWYRISEDKKLTEHDVDTFVKLTSDIVIDFNLDLQFAGIILKMLAEMRPQVILPAVIEKYSTLVETVNEPRKYLVSLKWCLITLTQMVGSRKEEENYDGRSLVLPFINSLLPCIDPNDIMKTISGLSCLYGIFSYIPLVDCSSLASTIDEDDEEKRELCLATSNLEDFLLQFVDKVFNLIESRTLENTRMSDNRASIPITGGASTEDSTIEKTIWAVFHRIAFESSTNICKSIIRKLVAQTFESTLEVDVAGKMLASLLQTFALAKPHLILPQLLPRLCTSVQNFIVEDMHNDEELDKTLLFHLQILSFILESNGSELIKFKSNIDIMLNSILKLNGKKAYGYASAIIKKLLLSLTLIYPEDSKLSEKDYDDPNYMAINDWGISCDIRKKINCKWHLLQDDEIEWAREIFSKVYTQASNDLKDIGNLKEKNDDLNKILLKRVTHLQATYDGIGGILLPFWEKTSILVPESVLDFTPIQTQFGFTNDIEIKIPVTGENAKLKYFELLKNILSYVNEYKHDDVEIYNALSKGFDSLIFPNIDTERRFFTLTSKSVSSTVINNSFNPKKKHSRFGLILRTFNIHMRRLLSAISNNWTESHMEIFYILFGLCLNRYFEVRAIAQARLTRVLDSVGQVLVRRITPKIIEKLQEGVPHHEFKGILYTIIDTSKYGNGVLIMNSWKEIQTLWLAILNSPISEKKSIIQCTQRIKSIIAQNYVHNSFDESVSESRLEYVDNMANSLVPENLKEKTKLSRVFCNGQENFDIYQNLLNEILNVSNDSKTHFRRQILGTTMISVLLLHKVDVPAKLVEFFFESLISKQIEMRTLALGSLIWILTLNKRTYPSININTENITLPPNETIQSFLQFKLNEKDSKIVTVHDINDPSLSGPLMIHKANYGYFDLPKSLKVKIPAKSYDDVLSDDLQTSGQKTVLLCTQRYIQSQDYLEKLKFFWCLEEKSKGLQTKRTSLIKLITRNNGPESCKKILSQFLPDLVKEKDQWKQRCVADVLSGMITGMKLWDSEIEKENWKVIEPLLSEMLKNVTQETLSYWSGSLSIPTNNRDPNKMGYYLRFLQKRFLKSMESVQSTSVESFKDIAFFECGLSNLQWRMGEIFYDNMITIKKYLTDIAVPYVNVRIQLGRLLSDSFEWSFEKSPVINPPKVDLFVEEIFNETLKNVIEETEKYEPNSDSPENEIIKNRLLRCKTVFEWLLSLTIEIETTLNIEIYKFIPILTHFENYELDQEISLLAGQSLAALSKTLVSVDDIGIVLSYLEKTGESNSWRSRLSVLEFLKVFVLFNANVFKTSIEARDRVLGLVLKLLEDRRIDVRVCASKILTGLVHVELLSNPMDLLIKFKKTTMLISKKFNKRAASNSEDIDKVHSSILGLCAFVDSNPYHVPKFLPDVLVFLTYHLNDPQPIPQTIKKCLSNFRRTHNDNWNIHKTKFSEDEIIVLTDIFVSPCYYA